MGLIRQLELLFDSSDPAPLSTAPAASPVPIGPTTPVPVIRPPSLPANVRWREVRTTQQVIGFSLRRSRRKSIGLIVNDDGLQVTAPNWVTLSQIDATVLEKSRWIIDKLAIHQARQTQLAMADTHWQDGGTIPYLGQRIVLRLDDSCGAVVFAGNATDPREGDALWLPLPVNAERNRVRDSVHTWLQQQARIWFGQRMQHFLAASALQIKSWRLSSAATRWGSCSSDGSIRLNWRLIHFDRDVIDYVVAHEIAHLREMNHSKDFWQEVGRILPDFEPARNVLRQHDPANLPLI